MQGFRVDDAHLDTSRRLTRTHQADGTAVRRGRVAVLLEGVGVGVEVALHAAADAGPQLAFGHAIRGTHCRAGEPGRGELVDDPLDGSTANRLGTVEGDLPGAEVQTGQLLRGYPAGDQVVREIG